MTDKYGVIATILPEEGEEEIWKDAPGFEDRYEVSSFGHLRNKKNGRERKIGEDNGGYPAVCLKIKNKVKFIYIHRLVCEAFYGAPPTERNICDHRDRCIVNNYYKNLHWVNHSENNLNSKPTTKRAISTTKTPIVFLNSNGKLIREFKNIIEASEQTGISLQQIQSNIRGFRKPFKNGYFKTKAEYLATLDKQKIL